MSATKVAPPKFAVARYSPSLADGARGWVIASERRERGNQQAKNPNTIDCFAYARNDTWNLVMLGKAKHLMILAS